MPYAGEHFAEGRVFGRWTVIDDTLAPTGGRPRRVLCRCVCGLRKLVDFRMLNDRSPGCADCKRAARRG